MESLELQADLQGYLRDIQLQFIEKRIDFLNSEQAQRQLSDTEKREYGELLIQSHAARQR
jgi:hypothetical protein